MRRNNNEISLITHHLNYSIREQFQLIRFFASQLGFKAPH